MSTQTRQHDSHQEHRTLSPSSQVVQIESSKLAPLIIVLAILTGVAIGVSIYSILYAKSADTEARMLEYYVLELDAKLIAAGIKRPDESVAAQLHKGDRK